MNLPDRQETFSLPPRALDRGVGQENEGGKEEYDRDLTGFLSSLSFHVIAGQEVSILSRNPWLTVDREERKRRSTVRIPFNG